MWRRIPIFPPYHTDEYTQIQSRVLRLILDSSDDVLYGSSEKNAFRAEPQYHQSIHRRWRESHWITLPRCQRVPRLFGSLHCSFAQERRFHYFLFSWSLCKSAISRMSRVRRSSCDSTFRRRSSTKYVRKMIAEYTSISAPRWSQNRFPREVRKFGKKVKSISPPPIAINTRKWRALNRSCLAISSAERRMTTPETARNILRKLMEQTRKTHRV